MKVTYKEQILIHPYVIRETIKSFHCISHWKPEGTSLIYFKLDRFNTKVVPEDMIIEITE